MKLWTQSLTWSGTGASPATPLLQERGLGPVSRPRHGQGSAAPSRPLQAGAWLDTAGQPPRVASPPTSQGTPGLSPCEGETGPSPFRAPTCTPLQPGSAGPAAQPLFRAGNIVFHFLPIVGVHALGQLMGTGHRTLAVPQGTGPTAIRAGAEPMRASCWEPGSSEQPRPAPGAPTDGAGARCHTAGDRVAAAGEETCQHITLHLQFLGLSHHVRALRALGHFHLQVTGHLA